VVRWAFSAALALLVASERGGTLAHPCRLFAAGAGAMVGLWLYPRSLARVLREEFVLPRTRREHITRTFCGQVSLVRARTEGQLFEKIGAPDRIRMWNHLPFAPGRAQMYWGSGAGE